MWKCDIVIMCIGWFLIGVWIGKWWRDKAISSGVNDHNLWEQRIKQIRTEIEQLHYHPKLDFIRNDDVVEMALDIIDKYKESEMQK